MVWETYFAWQIIIWELFIWYSNMTGSKQSGSNWVLICLLILMVINLIAFWRIQIEWFNLSGAMIFHCQWYCFPSIIPTQCFKCLSAPLIECCDWGIAWLNLHTRSAICNIKPKGWGDNISSQPIQRISNDFNYWLLRYSWKMNNHLKCILSRHWILDVKNTLIAHSQLMCCWLLWIIKIMLIERFSIHYFLILKNIAGNPRFVSLHLLHSAHILLFDWSMSTNSKQSDEM